GVLMRFTGRQPSQGIALDLNEAVLAMESEIRAEVRASLAIHTAERPVRAKATPDGLREAILILCVAAQRRMRDKACRIEITVESRGANQVGEVADNGELLSAEAQAHLF